MFETRAIASEVELHQAVRLAAGAFRHPSFNLDAGQIVAWLRAHPAFRPELVRVRVADGRVISQLWIVDRVMRIGLAEWRMGGISALYTVPEARSQGHATALMKDALEFMRHSGFDVTVLYGMNHFYRRFGYAVVWPLSRLQVPRREARTLGGSCALRPVSSKDVPTLVNLYEQAWERRPGALIRTESYWRWLLQTQRSWWVATDRRQAVRGYAVVSDQRPHEVIELVAADAETAFALIGHVAGQAPEDAGSLQIIAIRDDPLVSWLRRACHVTLIEETAPEGGWMARFIDLYSAFSKLSEELNARFLRSALRDWRGRVNLETELGTIALACRYGHLIVVDAPPTGGITCRIPQDRLMQLVMGFRSLPDVAGDPDVSIPDVAMPFLEVLFQPTAAGMAGLDWF
ncbi:MAG: GNAT family N-acetyltransferase [Anaerolineae bacterium]|nr:GNAT family N-acetyltransferase [Anaerolineae bacterium]MDW8098336.1 GNAT family N-acetyltransferase [Anaerolineae bacterium]